MYDLPSGIVRGNEELKCDDKHGEYDGLARFMRATPKLNPPGNFTHNVMERVSREVSPVNRIVQLRFVRFLMSPIGPLRDGSGQCSFCFVLTGLFYFLLGIGMLVGLKLSDTFPGQWIRLVPWFNIGAAFWLLVLGVIVVNGGRWSWVGTKAGTILFVFFFISGTVVCAKANGTPTMYIFAAMSWLSACVGVLLYYQVVAFSDPEIVVDNNTGVTTNGSKFRRAEGTPWH
ncbi:MAG: hypothetical protein AVO39_01810 [delta proteobacterium MLS_D]|jgi:hypothetical protein|nr:MAG: hypothetical protein AVO39_01810 [delta proteobacterium MLS_D]